MLRAGVGDGSAAAVARAHPARSRAFAFQLTPARFPPIGCPASIHRGARGERRESLQSIPRETLHAVANAAPSAVGAHTPGTALARTSSRCPSGAPVQVCPDRRPSRPGGPPGLAARTGCWAAVRPYDIVGRAVIPPGRAAGRKSLRRAFTAEHAESAEKASNRCPGRRFTRLRVRGENRANARVWEDPGEGSRCDYARRSRRGRRGRCRKRENCQG